MTIRISIEKIISILALLIPLVIGTFLRFYNFGKMIVFYGDSSRDFLTTYKIIKYHEWVWHGPAASVTWNLLSPIYYYLLIPFYLISGWHPLTQQVLTTLLSLLTICLIFLSIRDLLNQKAGFVAALIYAVGSVTIPENLIGLNPGFVPPATVLFTWMLLRTLKGNNNTFPLMMGSLAWMISFHASAFFIIPVLIIVWLIKKPQISKRNLVAGGLLFFFIAVIPYGIQEKKFDGYNFTTVYNYFFSKDMTAKSISEYVPLKTSLINYAQIIFKTPAEIIFPTTGYLTYVTSFILWAAFLLFIYRNRSQIPTSARWLIIILALYTLFFGVAVRFRFPERPNWWFGNVFFPLFTMTAGYLLSLIKPKWLLGLVILVMIVTNVIALWHYAKSGFFGQYSQEKEIALTVLKDAGSNNFDFKYIYNNIEEDGANGHFAYLFWFFGKPQFQEKYFHWLNWNTLEGQTTSTYLVFQNTSETKRIQFINETKISEGRQNIEVINKNQYYKIYKII